MAHLTSVTASLIRGEPFAHLSEDFTLIGVVLLFLVILWVVAENKDLATKLLGAILIVSLSFAAQNSFVYVCSIFIVATLVTDLQFLEKIAAILSKHPKYFDYLVGQASKQDIEDKAKIENFSGTTQDVRESLKFEEEVLNALEKDIIPKLPNAKLRQHVSISGGGEKSHIFDGLIEMDKVSVIVEIKNYKSDKTISYTSQGLDKGKDVYKRLYQARGIEKQVEGILIAPTNTKLRVDFDFLAFRFDKETLKFADPETLISKLASMRG